jgi:hypothetical protein
VQQRPCPATDPLGISANRIRSWGIDGLGAFGSFHRATRSSSADAVVQDSGSRFVNVAPRITSCNWSELVVRPGRIEAVLAPHWSPLDCVGRRASASSQRRKHRGRSSEASLSRAINRREWYAVGRLVVQASSRWPCADRGGPLASTSGRRDGVIVESGGDVCGSGRHSL